MTCCVAALCDKGKSIVLVSDKMIGTGMIESEPEISKVLWLHRNWRVMLAGDDIAPAFPIVEAAKRDLSKLKTAPTLRQVTDAIYKSYGAERQRQSEAIYLAPRGWTLEEFNSAKASILPESLREELGVKLAARKVEVSLLIAGFDSRGRGHIFSVDDYEERGKPRIQDLPGYHSIGSGSTAAIYFMAYREVSSVMPLRLALYYAVEGKYFGERAGGVGTKTDVLIIRFGKKAFKINEKVLEDNLFTLCSKLEPREIRESHVRVLNNLPSKSLASADKLKLVKEDGEWVIRAEGEAATLTRSSSRKATNPK
jgi:20S proteasome alpha/beta subunit